MRNVVSTFCILILAQLSWNGCQAFSLKSSSPASSSLSSSLSSSTSSTPPSVSSLSSSSSSSLSSTLTDHPTVSLKSTIKSQLAILDGAEWGSIQTLLRKKQQLKTSTKFGSISVVAGRTEDDNRIVAMLAEDDDDVVYEDSLAVIPDGVSDADAISTYLSSLSLHCVIPRADNVGGSDNSSMVGGKVIVLGSSELACFAAQGLASLGAQVSLVSPKSPKVKAKVGQLEVLKPAVGKSKVGFSSHVGKFEAVLDTIGDERPSASFFMNNDDDDDDNISKSGTSILGLLKSRHNCNTYISTVTQSQKLVEREGIFGGPKQTEEYVASKIGPSKSILKDSECQPMPPLSNIGSTIQTMLQNNVIFPAKHRNKLQHNKNEYVRGWTLSDFWESSTWPRDSSGSGGTRFGLPVVADDDPDDEPMIAEAPSIQTSKSKKTKYEKIDPDNLRAAPQPTQENPYVLNIAGVNGLKDEIVDAELDCILFLSARFCKTCKALGPQYTRLARIAKDENESSVSFVKAEASGPFGKELGRALDVKAVPTFLLFRKGQRYGSLMTTTKLPSKKIDKAIELLESGSDWDPSILKIQDPKEES